MTEFDAAPRVDVQAGAPSGRSRFFWVVTALGIAPVLLLCAALVLIAALRS